MKLRHLLSRQYTEESPSGRLQTLPWLKSPLEENQQQAFEFVNRIPGSDPKTVSSSDNGIAQSFVPPATVDFDLLGENQQPRQIRLPSHTVKHLHDDDEPKFRVHHEASSIELFYDLFFVANLATFTSNHPIDDPSSLASYMGFFTLLWFTWFQTSLYDVRFSIDSLFSRVCKALHLGVMTGFAIVGPIFQTDQAERDNRAFRSLSIVMMVSRLILAVQYCTVLWFVKGYKRTIAPVACTIGTLFVTAMMFLGMTFGFGPQRGSNAQDGWYVVSVVEALVILAVSSRWRILSFRHTHLVERVGLLTLIILGEGIIGMTKSLSSVMQGTTTVTGGSIGLVVCAVLIIVRGHQWRRARCFPPRAVSTNEPP
jgi:low temperature requirement protein LtrA